MMTGRVTAEREAIVPLQVRALGGRAATVQVVVDTGFSEFLALSQAVIERLALPYWCNTGFTLADGGEAELPVYRALVEWHGRVRPVSVVAIGAGALLGMALIEGSRLTLDAVPNGPVQIEPLA